MSRVLGSKAERVVFSDEDLEAGDTPCPWCCTGRRIPDGERWKCSWCGEMLGIQPHPIPAPKEAT